MAQSINEKDIVEVVEYQIVKYQKKHFLFFEWLVKLSAEKISRNIIIQTNDDVDKIYFNGKQLN